VLVKSMMRVGHDKMDYDTGGRMEGGGGFEIKVCLSGILKYRGRVWPSVMIPSGTFIGYIYGYPMLRRYAFNNSSLCT
jgi:hypothetical protein